MRSIQRRFKGLRLKKPDLSSYMIFSVAVRNQRFTKDKGMTHTFLNSFCANEIGEFIDPVTETACDFDARYFERNKAMFERIKKTEPDYTMEKFFTYHGVEIPLNIVRDILNGGESGFKQNMWGYLLKRIFSNHTMTTWFIQVVNNGGKGWKYQGPVKNSQLGVFY